MTSARVLMALAVVLAAAVSAATTVLQATVRTSASAAAGGGSSAQTLNPQLNHDVQAQLSVRGQILGQLKATRKKSEALLAALQASGANAAGHTASTDANAAALLVPMSSIASDGRLLTEEAPPGFDLTPQNNGLVPRLLSVVHSFCVDAETTAWGHVSRARGRPAHCDGG